MKACQVLKEWRTANHLTQKEAGVLFGVSQKAISVWERGVGNPDPWRLYIAWQHGSYDVSILAKRMLDTLGDKYQLP